MTEASAAAVPALVERARTAIKAPDYETALRALAAQSTGIVAITNADGYKECHAARVALKRARVEVDKVGRSAREDARAFADAVVEEVKRLTAIVEPEEARLQALQDAWDAAREAERKAKAEAEAKRVAVLQGQIDAIRRRAVRVVGMPAARIAEAIDELERLPTDATVFAELAEAAETTKAAALESMRDAHSRQVEAEAQAARLKAEREALEQRQREQEAAEAEARRRREAEDAEHRARLAREAEEQRRRIEAEEAERRKVRERQEEEDRVRRAAEEQRLAEQRAELARQQAEIRRQEEERAAAERREREAREAEEQRQREERLAEQRAELARSEAEVKRQQEAEFAAWRARVTATPIAALVGIVETIEQDLESDAEAVVRLVLLIAKDALAAVDAPAKAEEATA